jgi:hypothetical protein
MYIGLFETDIYTVQRQDLPLGPSNIIVKGLLPLLRHFLFRGGNAEICELCASCDVGTGGSAAEGMH